MTNEDRTPGGRDDLALLALAVERARTAREAGNHPFGAVVSDAQGLVLVSAGNTSVTDRDPTGHAELNAVREIGSALGRGQLGGLTLYSSAEPCAMCAGAIYWSGLGRVVYALSESDLLGLTGSDRENPTLSLPCRTVFAAGQRPVEVVGPVEVPGCREVHAGFWRP